MRFLDLGNGQPELKARNLQIVDINRETEIPAAMLDKRQNKNDFYRFLLMQNSSTANPEVAPQIRVNNDILIPRSILKRCDKKPGAGPLPSNVEEDPLEEEHTV